MAIEGSLADVSLADICQLLSMGRKSGCLTISDKSNFGYIFFDDGRVIYAALVNRPDRLGDLLVKNSVITGDDLQVAMDAQKSGTAGRLGEILVQQGALSQQDLEKYISIQIEEAVYHLFAWDDGSFQFKPDERPEEGVFLISVSADALLMEGARRVDEWSVMESEIPSLDLIFDLRKDPTAEEGIELTEHQRRIIPLLDGLNTVMEIVEESGLVEFDVGKALYGLIRGGFAVQVGRGMAADGDGANVDEQLNLGKSFYRSGMMEDSMGAFKKALEVSPNHPEARRFLGLISLRMGRPREAFVHFDELAGKVEPTYALLRNRAFALERMGQWGDALESLRQAEQLEPDDPGLVLARAIVLLKSGQALDALKAFHSYRGRIGDQVPPAHFFSYSVLAAGMAGDLDRAVEIGRQGLGHYPNDGTILVNTGGVVAHRGEVAAAEAFFKRAIDEGGNPPQAHKALGDEALKAGNKAEAKDHYETAIKIEPRLGEDVFIKLGALALEAQNRQEAGHYWRRAVEINPHNHELQSKLDQLEASAGA